ncbi:MAG: 3-hydroxyanthranilate 3,4-dioxygenase, partial [Woeseia sp.]|nr:3-hydroxyanthranilate 3,4-dioxygenase [Woeseia sp.]
MKPHPTLSAFNFENWVEEHTHLLKPPVANQLLHQDSGMIVMVVGGPNTRMDFHDDPVDEWFYQVSGDMLLKIAED